MDETYEAEIIQEVLLGDPQPFEALVREYQGAIYSLMLRNVRDSSMAADLAQESFTRAYARLETFKKGKRFFPWLYSIALNVARDHMRKSGRDFHVFMDNPTNMDRPEDRKNEQEAMENHLDGNVVFEFVQTMAPKYQEALILRYKHDFSMQEIANVLDISVSGAKMRISRGLEMLRDQFKEVSNVR
ncbi:MAG: RNA polymerase sigma factor [Pseudodesulfovibrio sp.]